MEEFLYRLALAMGIWDVEAWKKRITVGQLKRWMAYYRVDPWGSDWRRAGRAAFITAQAMGAKIDEEAEEKFLPTYRSAEQTEEQMIAELRKIGVFRKQMDERAGDGR